MTRQPSPYLEARRDANASTTARAVHPAVPRSNTVGPTRRPFRAWVDIRFARRQFREWLRPTHERRAAGRLSPALQKEFAEPDRDWIPRIPARTPSPR